MRFGELAWGGALPIFLSTTSFRETGRAGVGAVDVIEYFDTLTSADAANSSLDVSCVGGKHCGLSGRVPSALRQGRALLVRAPIPSTETIRWNMPTITPS
jgi:hypothetical protein